MRPLILWQISAWSCWSPWSHCDVTCGTGRKRRVRHCLNQAPDWPGCAGRSSQYVSCSVGSCACKLYCTFFSIAEYSPKALLVQNFKHFYNVSLL